MAEYRLFDPADPPPWLDPEWWVGTPNCDHTAHPAKVHDKRIAEAARKAGRTAVREGLVEIVDIGAGDGAVLEAISKMDLDEQLILTGYEIIRDSVKHANTVRGVDGTAKATVPCSRTTASTSWTIRTWSGRRLSLPAARSRAHE